MTVGYSYIFITCSNVFSQVWMGANDMEEKGVWRSILDGELMSDVYDGDLPWARFQPDNLKRKDEVQNVAGISRNDGRRDDSFEHYSRPYNISYIFHVFILYIIRVLILYIIHVLILYIIYVLILSTSLLCVKYLRTRF